MRGQLDQVVRHLVFSWERAGIGRQNGLKIRRAVKLMRVQVPPLLFPSGDHSFLIKWNLYQVQVHDHSALNIQ